MENLIVPVYLNQRILFDMIAMLQGGISTVSTVKKTEEQSKSNEQKATASFALSEALSTLLKISLSGEKATKSSGGAKTEQSEERVHTPASLFFTLRNLLLEREILQSANKNWDPRAGDIVELPLRLKRNPVQESIEMLEPLLKIVKAFDTPTQKANNSNNGNKKLPAQTNDYGVIEKQMSALISDLRAGGTVDLVGRSAEANLNVVITAETDYLRDPTMSDIVDGQYRIVGKVIFSGASDAEPLNLLRKSIFSRMPQITNNFLTVLSNLGTVHGIAVPEIVTTVDGPFIQIIPIAIYA